MSAAGRNHQGEIPVKNHVFAVLMSVGVAATSFAAPQSYPMQCRGGGSIGLTASTPTAGMYYGKAPHKASLGLGVGQCAWLDRAIGQNEPPCIQQFNSDATSWITANNLPSSTALTSTHYQPNSARSQWMRKLLSTAEYYTFYAYNPGNGGCFVMTSP